MKQIISHLKPWLRAPCFSPRGFVARAALITLAFAVCHFLGWREHTTFLSGSTAVANMSIKTSGTLGLIYIFTYLGFILAVPILLLAAALLTCLNHFLARKNHV